MKYVRTLNVSEILYWSGDIQYYTQRGKYDLIIVKITMN